MLKSFLLIGLVSTIANNCLANDFSVSCSYQNSNLQKCASVISDIVTDKFVKKFPAEKFEIFVHSNIHSYTNGGHVAYAVAGVVPRGSAQFPVKRFSNTKFNRSDKISSAVDLAREELENYRAAVTNLMDQCEISTTCDIYTAR